MPSPLLRLVLLGACASCASCAAEPAADIDEGALELAEDACKPSGSSPLVILGQGRGEYRDLQENEPVAVEAGPQGGHHVWLALRTFGLRQAASVTVRGEFPGVGVDVPPDESMVSLHLAEDGMCEIAGLRLQVDRTASLDVLVGEALDLEAEVTDETGDVGVATKRVVVASAR